MANGIDEILAGQTPAVSGAFQPIQQPSTGSKILSGLSAVAASPVTGLVTGGLSMILGGISSWYTARQQNKARKEAKKMYEAQLKKDEERYQQKYSLDLARFGLDRSGFMASQKQQKVANDNYYNERNYNRSNDWYTKLTNTINKPNFKNRLQSIYASAA